MSNNIEQDCFRGDSLKCVDCKFSYYPDYCADCKINIKNLQKLKHLCFDCYDKIEKLNNNKFINAITVLEKEIEKYKVENKNMKDIIYRISSLCSSFE